MTGHTWSTGAFGDRGATDWRSDCRAYRQVLRRWLAAVIDDTQDWRPAMMILTEAMLVRMADPDVPPPGGFGAQDLEYKAGPTRPVPVPAPNPDLDCYLKRGG